MTDQAHGAARRAPRLRLVATPEATIATWAWEGDGPCILLVHAAGFHGRCWDRVVDALPPTYRVIAVDCRGHGRSSTPEPPYPWSRLANDLVEVVDQLDLDTLIGVGHSMGGHLVTRLAAARPGRFDRLLLLDPVIVAPELFDLVAAAADLVQPVRRRSHFKSAGDMAEWLATRDSFVRWDPDVLDDYCQHALRPATDGNGLELACTPEIEGAAYVGQTDADIYDDVRSIGLPVHVVRCPQHLEARGLNDVSISTAFTYSPTWPELARQFRTATDQLLPHGTSHLFPMESPRLVAELIAAQAAAGSAPTVDG